MLFSHLDEKQRTELWAALALRRIKGLGAASAKKLADFFGSPYKAWEAIEQWPDCLPGSSTLIRQAKEGIWRAEARKSWEKIQASSANLLLYSDPAYPVLLREIPDAPLFLLYLGDITLLGNVSVAVVGARVCTREGMSVAAHISRELSQAGVTVVSGMAAGIDRVAHLAGLEGSGGSVAVLGSGIDVPYPVENMDLYDLLAKKGLLLSEFMPGAAPASRHFPIRNRIISGLVRGVLVVEAAGRSGSLITARYAAEQNREVFAVPGSAVAETSEGCRELIRRGAKPVFSAEDILLELAPMLRKNSASPLRPAKEALLDPAALSWDNAAVPAVKSGRPRSLSKAPVPPARRIADADKADEITEEGIDPAEKELLHFLRQEGDWHIDVLSSKLRMDVAALSGILTMLEIRGLIRRKPGMLYSSSK